MKKMLLIVMFSMSFCVEMTKNGILFSYKDKNAQAVFLVGSMNDWNQTMTPMQQGENGIWKVTLKLDPGKYSYKFIVDGTWNFDQENPNFEDDGFGGSNSIIEVNEDGKLLKKNKIINDGIKSSFNPKVYFQGRYLSNNLLLKNEVNRFMLNKPENDLNFGIKIKFSSNLEGYTLLNVNNITEGSEMWKTHLNYKRTLIKLRADYFNVTAFDNFGLITFDDPLHLVGNIGYDGYDFGYGQGGFFAETSDLLSNTIFKNFPMKMKTQILFADRIGIDDDDISAMRMKLSAPIINDDKFILGLSDYNYMTVSNEILQSHDNQAIDIMYIKYLNGMGWENHMQFKFFYEYSIFNNSNEGESKSTWLEGENVFSGMSIKFPAALMIYFNYHETSLQLDDDFSRNRFTFGFDFMRGNVKWKIMGQFWQNKLYSNLDWSNYYKYFEMTDGNGRWFQEYSDVPYEKYTILGYETGFMWESNFHYDFKFRGQVLETILKNKFAHHGISHEPKFIENIIIFKYAISESWKLLIDTRIPYYDDPFLQLKTDFKNDKDVFVSNYTEITYYFSNDVWLSVGYGVDPIVVNLITDEFYDRGRQEYLNDVGNLSEYLKSFYGGLGDKIRQSEKSLMDEKRISLQAVVTF